MKRLNLLVFFFYALTIFRPAMSQEVDSEWDNIYSKNWPDGFVPVDIPSSFDNKIQKAVFYKSSLLKPQPLIVSLHTWSGDYLQEDPLAEEIVLRGWNYIHPDFRGPNNRPEACGSDAVLSDIQDAIVFAVEQGNVDTSEVHIIGVSGGGYATLLAFMQLNYPVKSFNSWAAISNLEDWYWECKGRGLKYAGDLEKVTTAGKGFNAVESQKRSPALMNFPEEKRKQATLHIYTGIHDGYTGSVPVTHSINMFNHLVKETVPDRSNKIVSDSLKLVLLEKRLNPNPDTCLFLGERKIHLQREIPHITLTVFEGTHEMIVPQALALLPVYEYDSSKKMNILTVGDSNGAAQNGWPVQLAKLLPFSTVINESVSGNTIGFNNLDNPKLNTLRNMEAYLDSAFSKLPSGEQLDCIVFCLGTNDAKKVFNDSIEQVPANLDSLLNLTKNYFKLHKKKVPDLVVVSPPPMNEKMADSLKYGGGNIRIDKNNILFKKVAEEQNALFIDINSGFKKSVEEITVDGVHLTANAQFKMAQAITNVLKSDSYKK